MKKAILLLTYISLFISTFGQFECIPWVTTGNSPYEDMSRNLVCDSNGNSYICGMFSGTANFQNTQLTSLGGTDSFIAKYNGLGQLVWIQHAGSSLNDRGFNIDVDNNGNVYVIGDFEGTFNIGNFTFNSNGDKDMYVCKYNSNGQLQWAVKGGGTGIDMGRAIKATNNNEIIAIGYFSDFATYGPFSLSSYGGNDIVVVKYNSNGNPIWISHAGSSGGDDPRGLFIDNMDNIWISGYFSSVITFQGTAQTLTSLGTWNAFFAKMNPQGNFLNAFSAGGMGKTTAEKIQIDNQNNIIIGGYFTETANFGGSSLLSNGGLDVFIAKYNNLGAIQWVNQGGGIGDDFAIDIDVSPTGEIWATGYFSNSAFFGNQIISSNGMKDVFVVNYSPTGIANLTNSFGGLYDDIGYTIKNKIENTYVSGVYGSSINIGNFQPPFMGVSDLFLFPFGNTNQTTDFTHIINNLTVEFTTNTPLPDSVLWDFGDGSYSTEFNPQHTYPVSTIYQAILTGYFPCSTDTAVHTIQLCEPAFAFFVYEPSYLLVHYNNTNTIADSIRWYFGDGTTSTQNNPEHIFANPGNYTTTLVAYNTCSIDTLPINFFVCDSMSSSFTYSSTGNIVAFTTTSYNFYDVFWDFGDGNTSTEPNPVHEYLTAGSFIVNLYSINPCDSLLSKDTIVICELPISTFTYDYIGDMTFSFNNLSTNYTSCLWIFGDGDSSTLVNPMHTYDSCMPYDVSLQVTNECGTTTQHEIINLLTNILEKTTAPYIIINQSPFGNIEIYSRDHSENSELRLYSISGALVLHKTFTTKTNIKSNALKNGMYILKITNSKGIVFLKKILL